MNRNLTVSINTKKNSQKCCSISSTIKFNFVKLKIIILFPFILGNFFPAKTSGMKKLCVFFILWNFLTMKSHKFYTWYLRYMNYLNWYMTPVATNQLCFLKMQCSGLVSGCIILRLVRMDIR